jgi:hypothetical protein
MLLSISFTLNNQFFVIWTILFLGDDDIKGLLQLKKTMVSKEVSSPSSQDNL